MAKKERKKAKNKKGPQGSRPAPAKKGASYSPAEIAMAVLGAALLVLFAGIVITSIFGSG